MTNEFVRVSSNQNSLEIESPSILRNIDADLLLMGRSWHCCDASGLWESGQLLLERCRSDYLPDYPASSASTSH